MTIIGSAMAIIGRIQNGPGRVQIRGIGEVLNMVILKDDPKTLYPGQDPYLRHDLKRLLAIDILLAWQFDHLKADG